MMGTCAWRNKPPVDPPFLRALSTHWARWHSSKTKCLSPLICSSTDSKDFSLVGTSLRRTQFPSWLMMANIDDLLWIYNPIKYFLSSISSWCEWFLTKFRSNSTHLLDFANSGFASWNKAHVDYALRRCCFLTLSSWFSRRSFQFSWVSCSS